AHSSRPDASLLERGIGPLHAGSVALGGVRAATPSAAEDPDAIREVFGGDEADVLLAAVLDRVLPERDGRRSVAGAELGSGGAGDAAAGGGFVRADAPARSDQGARADGAGVV